MMFLQTTLATDFREPSTWWQRLIKIDTANPSYRLKHHLVRSWLIEFDDNGAPWREIGLDKDGAVVLAGPSKKDYGFWVDSDIRYADIVGEPITEEYFEQMWAVSGVVAP